MENSQLLVLLVLCGSVVSSALSQTIHKMAVRSDIRFRFATTEMTCLMSNDAEKATELVFDVTLPKDAFIANFSMEIEGKTYPGRVKQKQEARKEYLAARRSGSSGGLVDRSARHSNKFDVSVNIAARSNVTFTLIYQELLRRRFGSYEYSIYIDKKDLKRIRDYSVEIFIQDRTEIRDVRTPAMRKEVISSAVEQELSSLTQITHLSETTVYVVYRPTLEELQVQGSGWFVVQYDIQSHSAGDLLVVDGYFVHFFVPPDDLPPLPLDLVFLLDISGSMLKRKIQQLKEAMKTIVDDLRETDRFTILLFDSHVQYWEKSLQQATAHNVRRAHQYIQRIRIRGGTNLHLALMKGLKMLQGSREASRVPMLFFLTDGRPTVGQTNSARIVADVTRGSEGLVSIYSLAFGVGADYSLLKKISTKNKGFARKIYEASDAAQQVSGLYREISTIVIRELTVSYDSSSNNDGGDDKIGVYVDNSTVTICDLSSLYGNSDFVVAGRLGNADTLVTTPEAAGGLTLAVTGLGAEKQINFVLEENDLNRLTLEGDNPFWVVPRDLSKMSERTWAFLSIKQLLKEKVAAQENPHLVKDLDKQILDLSLKYHFVTPLTSMVVTRPEDNLNKKQSVAASFRDDEDMPAAIRTRKRQIQAVRKWRKWSRRTFHQPSSSSAGSWTWGSHSPSGGGLLRSFRPPHRPSYYSDRNIQVPKKPKRTKLMRFRIRKRKNRNRTRNRRVILQSLVIRNNSIPTLCYELAVGRTRHAHYSMYSLLANQQGNFAVQLALKKRHVKAISIQHDNSLSVISVDSQGKLILHSGDNNANNSSQVSLSPSKLMASVHDGLVNVTVRVSMVTWTGAISKRTRHPTPSFLSIEVDSHDSDLDHLASRYTGSIVGWMLQNPPSRRKTKAKRKKQTPACISFGVSPKQSGVMTGRELEQFRL